MKSGRSGQTLQDIHVEALTMLELRKCDADIACLSEVRIPGNGLSVIGVPGEETCYHVYHSGQYWKAWRGNRCL